MRLILIGILSFFLVSCSSHQEKKIDLIRHNQESLPVSSSLKKCKKKFKSSLLPDFFLTPFSFSFSEGMPLEEIFKIICKKQPLSFSLHPQVRQKKGFLYHVHRKPLIQIIEDLCDITQCRYHFEHGTLFIEEDLPHLQIHSISFLLGSRKAQNQLSITTDLLATPEGKGGENSSNTKLSATAMTDFWGELQQNLDLILIPHPIQESLLPVRRPEFEATIAETEPSQGSKRTIQLLGASSSPQSRFSQKSDGFSPQSTAPKLSSSKTTLPYALHKQAGLLSVYGTHKQHKLIAQYLKRLKKLVRTQITIEAKIFEVLLNENFKTGIDWHLLGKNLGLHLKGGGLEDRGNFAWEIQGNQFSSFLSWMEKFGTVRTLSNPRITVLNNQPALLKVAKNEVFFRLEIDRVLFSDHKPDLETTVSHMQTVPIGLMMMVHPSIDPETEEITLTLRPSLSRVVEMRDDPAVAIRSDNKIHSHIPVVQMREIDSVIKLKPDETVVLGGLIEENLMEEHAGFPGSHTIPFWGHLLSQKTKSLALTELVIFLKASFSHLEE